MRGILSWKDVEELKKYEFVHQIASDAGKGFHKVLILRVIGKKGVYEVVDKQKIVGTFQEIEDAINCYNDILTD